MKKFNNWYNEAIADFSSSDEISKNTNPSDSSSLEPEKVDPSVSSLGSIKRYADLAAKRGENKTFNYEQVNALLKTFLSQFKKSSEQRLLVNILRQKMIRPYDMFETPKT